MCVCLCARVWARACVNGWTSWMKAGFFLFFFPSCRQEVRSSCWDGDSPHPLATPSHCTSMLVGANLNESYRHTIWMKQTVLTTWLMKVLSNISLPQQTGRSHSAVHIGTGAQKCRHTHLSSVIRKLQKCLPLCCWLPVNTMMKQSVKIIFASYVQLCLQQQSWVSFNDEPPIQLRVSESDNE